MNFASAFWRSTKNPKQYEKGLYEKRLFTYNKYIYLYREGERKKEHNFDRLSHEENTSAK